MVRISRRRGWEAHGVDNNMRHEFFGVHGDTTWNLERLRGQTRRFEHHDLDIRDRAGIAELVELIRPRLIVHCAAPRTRSTATRRTSCRW